MGRHFSSKRRSVQEEGIASRLVSFVWRRYYLAYTVSFIMVALCTFCSFVVYRKSFIMMNDGLWQHYNALMYYGIWLRSIAKNLLAGKGLVVPLFDFSIGYGDDAITTFSYYCLGDPLALLSALVPARYSEYLFDLLVVLRLYLAGLAFSLFCLCHDKDRMGTLAAALVYSLCGWALYGGTRHPFFANPMIYLPLLLIGFDLVLEGKSPLPFIGAVFVSAISNFYYLYMLVIFLALYALLRFFSTGHNHVVRDFFSLLARCMLYGCIGVALAGVVLYPTVLAALGTARGSTAAKEVLYSGIYYQQFLSSFITTDVNTNAWREEAYSAPALLAIFALFAGNGRRNLKVAFLLLVTFFLFPIFGTVLNGFKYASNRWSWAFSALVAYILANEWEELVSCSVRIKKIMLVTSACYALACFASPEARTEGFFASLGLLLIAMCSIALMGSDARPAREQYRLQGVLMVLICGGIILNGYMRFDIKQRNYVESYVDFGTAYRKVRNKTDKLMAEYTTCDGFSRYERESTNVMNAAVNTHGYSVESYWSLMNPNIIQYLSELEMSGKWLPSRYHDLDGRAYLEKLASVRYYLADKYDHAPYGYELLQEVGDSVIYEDQNALPLGYTYSNYLSRSSYEQLSAYDKQQALLQAVVLDDASTAQLSESVTSAGLRLSATEHAAKIKAGSSVYKVDEMTYISSKAGAKLTISFEGDPGCETYLHIKGLAAEPRTTYDLYQDKYDEQLSQEQYEKLSSIEKTRVKSANDKLNLQSESIFMFTVKGNGRSRKLEYTTAYYSCAKTQTDYLANLGYSEEGLTEATILLPKQGVYTIESIEVVCQPMDQLGAYVSALAEDVLEDVTIGTNKVTGSISLAKDKVLCFSIPYDSGWSATVDGKDVELLKANTMFMALPLEAGDHTVELTYRTRGLVPGTVVSVAGLACLALVVYVRKHRIWQKDATHAEVDS